MKAIRLEEPERLANVEIGEANAPGPGEALVRVHRVGICGTDISGYLGKFPFMQYPRILGHELGVEVLQIGDGVTQVQPGDRCSVEPYMNDPASYATSCGRPNCCEHLNVLGVMVDGGMREQFVLRADKLHAGNNLAFEQLALVETLAIGCHAVDRAALQPDQHCLIVGAGPIGLAALEFAQLTGAPITVVDLNQQRLAFCREKMHVGRTLVASERIEQEVRDLCDGHLADVIIDATGSRASMETSLRLLAPGGKLLLVGITTGEITLSHPAFHKIEGTLMSSRNALPRDFDRIIRLIETGKIDTRPWITHHTPMESLPDVFASYTRPETGVVKAVVEVT